PLLGVFIAIAWGLGELGTKTGPARSGRVALTTWPASSSTTIVAAATTGSRSTARIPAAAVGVAATGIAAATLLPLFAMTRVQVGYWTDSTALFEHALAVTSDNWMAHNNLGGVLSSEGRAEEAIRHFTEVLRIRPEYADAHYNMGIALEKL